MKEYINRYLWFILGLFILSMGIAMSTKADLGVSPVSSIPYVLSLALPFSLGKITIVVQLVYILCQILLLRKEFKLINFAQIIIVVIYGYFNDISMWIFQDLHPQNYAVRWVLCLASMFVIAFGVNLEVKAGVMMLAVDYLMVCISKKFHIDFGKVKIAFDCSQVALAVVCSLLLMRGLFGVREGTVAAAVIVGLIVKFYNKKLMFFYEAIGLVKRDVSKGQEETGKASAGHLVITIAREVGSGGYEIGQLLGEMMDLPVYDKDMVQMVAKESGLTPEYVIEHEQRIVHRFFREIYESGYTMVQGQRSDEESLFQTQEKVVRRIAKVHSCIIVGRLGGYFLRNTPGCFHVFIHGEREYRIDHYRKEHGISYEAAAKEVAHGDSERKNHFKYYTGEEFGTYSRYHLSVDSSVLGSEEAAKMIRETAERYYAVCRERKVLV